MDFVFERADRRPIFSSPWQSTQRATVRMTRMRYNRRVKPFTNDDANPSDQFFDAIEARPAELDSDKRR